MQRTGRPARHRESRRRIVPYVLEHRGELLAAVLTVARHWFAEGCPAAEAPPLGGFEEWTTTIGGILANAGVTGFLGNCEALYEQIDEDEAEWTTFLEAWFATYGTAPQTCSVVADYLRTEGGNELRAALPGDLAEALAGEAKGRGSFTRRLGHALAGHDACVYDRLASSAPGSCITPRCGR